MRVIRDQLSDRHDAGRRLGAWGPQRLTSPSATRQRQQESAVVASVESEQLLNRAQATVSDHITALGRVAETAGRGQFATSFLSLRGHGRTRP